MPVYVDGYIQALREALSYDIEDVSTEAGSFPASSVALWEFQQDPWKTTAKDVDQYIIGDLGAAKELNAFVILNCNAPEVVVQFNDTADFTTPAVTTGALALSENVLTERLNILFNPQDHGAVNHRYFRVLIPGAQTTHDGEEVYSIGGIAVGDALEDFMFDVNPGFSIQGIKPAEVLEMLGGRTEVWEFSSFRQAMVIMTMNVARDPAEFSQLMRLIFTTDKSTPIILGFNQVLHETEGGSWVMPMKKLEDPDYTIQQWGMGVAQRITFKETK